MFERTTRSSRVSHGVYISCRATDLEFRNNYVLNTDGGGHGLKCGADRCHIEGNVIAALDGSSSRAIDVVLGGETYIANNILQLAPNSEQDDLIGLAMELSKGNLPVHETLVEGNIFIADRPDAGLFDNKSPGPVVVRGNRFVNVDDDYYECKSDSQCGQVTDGGENAFYASREDAGLGAFPFLPTRVAGD